MLKSYVLSPMVTEALSTSSELELPPEDPLSPDDPLSELDEVAVGSLPPESSSPPPHAIASDSPAMAMLKTK